MANHRIVNLDDCTEYRQTLLARPPKIVHGAALLLVALVLAASGWAAWTKADLVVRARGRIRPVDEVTRVFTPAGSELDSRVEEVHFEEGAVVKKGQVLLQLNTQRLDNCIAELETRIAAAERELSELGRRDELLQLQREAAFAKAKVELAEAEERLCRAQTERQSRIRQMEAEWTAANDAFSRMQALAPKGAVSQEDLVKARSETQRARERLEQARLPPDDGEVNVLRCALEAVFRDFAVREAELDQQKAIKQGEAEAARKELANLELARKRCVLRAPLDGVVVLGRIKVGDVLEAGKAVVDIAPCDDIHLAAAVPSEDVGELEVGMPVKIKFDAFDYQMYGALDGEVYFISPDSQVQQDANKSDSAAYLVRVQLHGKSVGRGRLRGNVKLGMEATAEIVTERQSLLEEFLKKIRRSISL